MQRLLAWIGRQLAPVFDARMDTPLFFWLMAGTLILLGVAIIARAAYVAYVYDPRTAALRDRSRRGPAAAALDPWLRAQQLAARGAFTEAAHALYEALLVSIALQEQIPLHPSKTLGDYARDLRARASAALPRFRDFARSYEVVIYGTGRCDRDRYAYLLGLASPLVQPLVDGRG